MENFWRKFFEPVDDNHKKEFAFEKDGVFTRNMFFTNIDQLTAEIMRRFDNHNLYVSVYNFNEYNEPWIDKIFLDFDAGSKQTFNPLTDEGKQTLQEVLEEVKKVASFLENRYEVKPLVLFSGNRGFHIYLFSIPVLLKHPKETLKTFLNWVKNKLDLKYVDTQLFSDIRRVARLPYSVHQKTKLYCVPISLEMSIDEILQLAREPKPTEWKKEITDILGQELFELDKEINKRIKETLEKRVIASEIKPEGGYLSLPCMKIIKEEPLLPREQTPGEMHGRRQKAAKFLAIAYYLDHGTTEGFEVLAQVFAERQRAGHPLRVSEITGWARWIRQKIANGETITWNCQEVRDYLRANITDFACPPTCPYIIAYQEWLEKKQEQELHETLSNFNLIKKAKKWLDKWVIGEKQKKVLLFLLLLHNQSVFVVGNTSTGKTNLVDSVLRLFKRPHEENGKGLVAEVSAMTEKALRWIDRDRIPILYLKEMPPELSRFNLTNSMGMDLKLAMSDKKIIIWYTDASARPPVKREREIHVDSVIWTTTATEMPEDFENRAWILNTDESPELTEKVVEWKAQRRAQIEEEKLSPEEKMELDTIYKAIKFLRKRTKVIIPFAKTLTKLVNKELPRARRDIDKILDLISAVAKTNYVERKYRIKTTGEETIIASPEDGIFALGLIKDLFPRMQLGLEDRIEKAYRTLKQIEIRKAEANADDLRVTTAEFAAELNISQSRARQLLKTLVYKGLAQEERVGNRNMYSSVPIEVRTIKLDFSEIVEEYKQWWEQYGDLLEKE